jgi:hypothetical protein
MLSSSSSSSPSSSSSLSSPSASYSSLQAGYSGMSLAQPFLSNLHGASDRRLVLQQRVQIAALTKVYDLLAETLDPVRLGREDQRALALAGELPRSEEG